MDATLRILEAAKAPLTYERIEIGESVYTAGHTSGIAPETWDTLRRTRVFLKSPITTPQGGGYKSLNVTLRKTLGMFANVRPNKSYRAVRGGDAAEHEPRHHSRERGGHVRRHRAPADDEVVQTLKLISRPGCEAIVRYAFEYARAHGRKKVTCMTKDNIMKMTDGLFHRVFDEIATEYPELENEHRIIDIGSAVVAARPEMLDVIVAPNLYGDIISDIAAEVSGSVGVAGSANIGSDFAMFEAIHGSAPDIAGRGVANPSGLLNGAVMMLVHVGQPRIAETIKNAWLATLEAGIHTPDIYRERTSERQVTTQGFADAVIERLGREAEDAGAGDLRRQGRPRRGQALRAGHEGARGRGRVSGLERGGPRPGHVRRTPGRGGNRGAAAEADHQPRRQGLPGGPAGDVLHRPLALPLHAHGRQRHGAAGGGVCRARSSRPASTSSRRRTCTRSTASAATRSLRASSTGTEARMRVGRAARGARLGAERAPCLTFCEGRTLLETVDDLTRRSIRRGYEAPGRALARGPRNPIISRRPIIKLDRSLATSRKQ